MDGSLNQLMRLLANRGTEWLRQKIMELPDPCPVDHPGIGLLARAGRVAPVLTGFRGRLSPLEVIVQRRLRPDLVRAAAARIIAGDRSETMVELVLSGALVARTDPTWQMAGEALVEDGNLPLSWRLALSDAPSLPHQAEALLTAPQTEASDAEQVRRFTELLMQLCQHGARRPRLSAARSYAAIFRNLQTLADRSRSAGCVRSRARLAICLCLLDPEHDITDLMADLIQVQRPDGSFPPRLSFSTANQPFKEGGVATLEVVTALHAAVYRRWRGARPVWISSHPLRQALRDGAEEVTKLAGNGGTVETAVLLSCATGGNWLHRLSPERPQVHALPRLARLCFRDPVAARHLRHWLNMPDPGIHIKGVDKLDERWLRGKPVTLRAPSPTLLALWERAALSSDETAFVECTRLAWYHHGMVPTPPIQSRMRQMAAQALQGCRTGDLALASLHLERLLLLSRAVPVAETMGAAA